MTFRTRRLLPLLLLLLALPALHAGCERGEAAEDPVLIPDFVERSPEARCRDVPTLTALGIRPEEVASLPDGGILVTDARSRRLWFVGPDLEVNDSLALDVQGPRGVVYPRSAIFRRNGWIVVSDGTRGLLLLLRPDGSDEDRVRLDFIPDRLLEAPDGTLLVTRAVRSAGSHPLIYRVGEGDGEGGVVPLGGIRTVRERDFRLQAVGNLLTLVEAGPDAVLAFHRALIPRAYRLSGEGLDVVDTLDVPLPDGLARAVGFRPVPPFTERDVLSLLVPVEDVAPAGAGDIHLLGHSGRERDGRPEKAVIRVGPDLEVGASVLLPMEAAHIAPRPGGDSLLVVDELERWHVCPAP